MSVNDILTGLTAQEAKDYFANNGITNYNIVYYTDRKQKDSDTDIVVRTTYDGSCYTVLVCPMRTKVLAGE